MGMRFRKSKKIAPGVRVNLNAKSASISIGPKGFKKTFSTSGRTTTTVGIPGTGVSYSTSKKMGAPTAAASADPIVSEVVVPVRSQKNKGVALVLCVLLGYMGIHRFYVGKIGTGILWLLTLGCFGIGWIVDIVMLCCNKFADKSGAIIGLPETR